jgi:hypothetical protein
MPHARRCNFPGKEGTLGVDLQMDGFIDRGHVNPVARKIELPTFPLAERPRRCMRRSKSVKKDSLRDSLPHRICVFRVLSEVVKLCLPDVLLSCDITLARRNRESETAVAGIVTSYYQCFIIGRCMLRPSPL